MTKWKVSMSMASFMIGAIELLNIKDHYNPERITETLVYSVIAFIATIGIGVTLFITGFKRKHQSQHRS